MPIARLALLAPMVFPFGSSNFDLLNGKFN